LVIGDGLRLSLIGIVLGVLGAAAATKLLQRSLSGIHDADIWSFTLGGVMLLGVSATACLIPTLRATAVDPAVAVRTE
jgi:putative ABC transport system permease protein